MKFIAIDIAREHGRILRAELAGAIFEIECVYFEGVEYRWEGSTIAIKEHRIPVISASPNVGNMMWDRLHLQPRYAIELFNLLQREGFRCTCGYRELFRRFNRGDYFRRRQLREYMHEVAGR